MSRVLCALATCTLMVCLAPKAEAQLSDRDVREHYYSVLEKDPTRALLWDALIPGAGSVYNGLYANAVFTFAVSVAGASIWTYGALADDDTLYWVGAGTFAAGRAYGLVTAPVGSLLLNAAFRRHLHLAMHF